MDIKTADAFANALDLLMQPVARSYFLADKEDYDRAQMSAAQAARADKVANMRYGFEVVNAVERRGHQSGYKYTYEAGYSKDLIIGNLIKYAFTADVSLNDAQQRNMVDALKEAAELAAFAVARRKDGVVIDDPRHRTCEAATRGLALIACSALPDVTKDRAVQALVELGSKVHAFQPRPEQGPVCNRIIESDVLQMLAAVVENDYAGAKRVMTALPTNTGFPALVALQIGTMLTRSLFGDASDAEVNDYVARLQSLSPREDGVAMAERFVEVKVASLIDIREPQHAEITWHCLGRFMTGMMANKEFGQWLVQKTGQYAEDMKASDIEAKLGGMKRSQTVTEAALTILRETYNPVPNPIPNPTPQSPAPQGPRAAAPGAAEEPK